MMAAPELVENHSNNGEGFDAGYTLVCHWPPSKLGSTPPSWYRPICPPAPSGRRGLPWRVVMGSRGAEDEIAMKRSAFPTPRRVVSIQQQSRAARAIIS